MNTEDIAKIKKLYDQLISKLAEVEPVKECDSCKRINGIMEIWGKMYPVPFEEPQCVSHVPGVTIEPIPPWLRLYPLHKNEDIRTILKSIEHELKEMNRSQEVKAFAESLRRGCD